jgi:hypothetical protein
MLVDAFEQCGDKLEGNIDVCPLLAASKDVEKAVNCFASGDLVTEVSLSTDL